MHITIRSVVQLVEHRTPVVAARVRDAPALDTKLLTEMVCGRWQRPRPAEVSERGGP